MTHLHVMLTQLLGNGEYIFRFVTPLGSCGVRVDEHRVLGEGGVHAQLVHPVGV